MKSLIQSGTQVHKMLSGGFMALSLTEATPRLSLNSVNNTDKVGGAKQSWAMEEEEQHPEGCAQAIASYVLCSEVLTGGLDNCLLPKKNLPWGKKKKKVFLWQHNLLHYL